MTTDNSRESNNGARAESLKLTRRELLQSTGMTTLALGTGMMSSDVASAQTPTTKVGTHEGPFNILFVLTDQERYFRPGELPPGYKLPGRDSLKRRGVTFTNHQTNSMVCTSSRSVIYTGQHIQHTRLFDNMDCPWMRNVNLDVPTIGDMLGQAGYYPAYMGKWHLSRELGTHNEFALPQVELTRVIESFGFKDYVGIGDVIGHTQGGYINDEMIGAQAQRWLRLRGKPMNQRKEPWYLAVNIVNPHDVMFYNTDEPGRHVQDTPKPMSDLARDPDSQIYKQQWDIKLPRSRHEPFEKHGRPAAHMEYQLARAALVGQFPDEDPRWRRLINYYLNCIQHTDLVLQGILDELETLGLTDSTIVVMTADHGELGGGHGTHGKGAMAYREQNQIPLIISHPGYAGVHGQECRAVTSHIDLAPTMMNWSGTSASKLTGKDLTPLLVKGDASGVNEIRDGALYCYNMFLYLDSNFNKRIQAYLNSGGDPQKLTEQGFKPDLGKRGHIRSVVDGRYRFSRYFSPKQFNQPRTLEGILALNDVELFDLEADPDEMNNLATNPGKYGELMVEMNGKINQLLEDEVGEPDDGRFLPGDNNNWAAATFDP